MPDIKPTNETKSGYSHDIKPSKETERLILESVLVKKLNGVIEKQNDEIDMLLKQKQFLQSKLREATNGKSEQTVDQRRK